MGHIVLGDESLIGGVVEDDSLVFVGVVHPGLQLLLGSHGAGGVVGKAQVDHIHLLLGDMGGKPVLLHAGHVDQLGPLAQLLLEVTGPAGHGVGIHIHGVDGVTHGHHVVGAEDVADVAAVALGAVGDKDLVGLDIHAPGGIVGLGNGLPQEIVALLGTVAVEALKGTHLIHRLVHGFNDSGGQRPGHITDAQTDHLGLGVLGGVSGQTAGDLRKQIAAGQLEEILVHFGHSVPLLCAARAKFHG